MDFAQVLMELWRRRAWLVAGVLAATFVAVSTSHRIEVLPPGLEDKQLAIGTADTQLLVDTPKSAITDLGMSFKALSERAGVYARLMTTRPVRRAIARRMEVPEESIVTRAPLPAGLPRAAREPDRATRSRQLIEEGRSLVLTFTSDQSTPTITIQAEAPDAPSAVRLADAAANGFTAYVRKLERVQGVPVERRVQLRRLGRAQGGTVGGDADLKLAVLAFAGTFIGWCLLVLLVANVVAGIRTLRAGENAEPGREARAGDTTA